MSAPEVPERDPLADLVSRSLGTRVESVDAEDLAAIDGVERRRLRFATREGATTVLFERSPAGMTLEAQLLPFLARKSDRVPAVHARGLPPPHASLGPWLLLEDALGSPTACEGDVGEIVGAKLAIERAVANDVPALRGLGVPVDARPLPAALASLPRGLLHGDLRCAVARRLERGVVITAWARATIGCPVLDAAGLALAFEHDGRPHDAAAVHDAYAMRAEIGDAVEAFAAAMTYLRDLGRR